MRKLFSGRAGMMAAFLIGAIAATAATAGAASLITGSQIKDGTITKKDLAKALQKQIGKRGVAGPAGAPGATGPAGRDGAPGPFPDVLPRGKTVSGTWSISGSTPNADFDYLDSPVSFGFRFSVAPAVVTVGPGESGTQAAIAAGCGGSLVEPAADPGRLCIYQSSNSGNLAVLKYRDDSNVNTVGGANATVSAYAFNANGSTTDWGTALRTGAVIEVQAHLANTITYTGGTWAATSP